MSLGVNRLETIAGGCHPIERLSLDAPGDALAHPPGTVRVVPALPPAIRIDLHGRSLVLATLDQFFQLIRQSGW